MNKATRGLNVFTTQEFIFAFKDEDGLPLMEDLDSLYGVYCKIHYLSNGEFVLFYKTTMYHFDRNQSLKHKLRFDLGIPPKYHEPVCLKLRDETILFLDFVGFASKYLGRLDSNLVIYDPKTTKVLITFEANGFNVIHWNITLLELENGNILAQNSDMAIYCWDKKGNLLLSIPIQCANCIYAEWLKIETNRFYVKEIEENKILIVSKLCHYLIIDLKTLQTNVYEINFFKEGLLEIFNLRNKRPKTYQQDLILLNNEMIWLNLKGLKSFIYDFKRQQFVRETRIRHIGSYILAQPNLLFYFAREYDSYFINSRSDRKSNTDVHKFAQAILHVDQRIIVTLDFQNRLVFHKLHFRFSFFLIILFFPLLKQTLFFFDKSNKDLVHECCNKIANLASEEEMEEIESRIPTELYEIVKHFRH
jgi:hypothetical protein